MSCRIVQGRKLEHSYLTLNYHGNPPTPGSSPGCCLWEGGRAATTALFPKCEANYQGLQYSLCPFLLSPMLPAALLTSVNSSLFASILHWFTRACFFWDRPFPCLPATSSTLSLSTTTVRCPQKSRMAWVGIAALGPTPAADNKNLICDRYLICQG